MNSASAYTGPVQRNLIFLMTAFLLIVAGVSPPTVAAQIPYTLPEALTRLTMSPEVIAAYSAWEAARLDAMAAGYRGDTTFSLTPAWKSSWMPDSDLDRYGEMSATFTAAMPLGLGPVDQLRLQRAVARTRIAEADLRLAILNAAAGISATYHRAGIAVAETAVLRAEAAATQLRLEADEARYAAGEVSLMELLRTRDDHQKALQSEQTGRLRAELALLDLMLRLGEPVDSQSIAGALASRFEITREPLSIPLLETVTIDALQNHPAIVRQTALLDIAVAETSPVRDPLLSTVRVSLSIDDHTGSLAYTFARPSVSLSYTPPAYGVGTPLPSGSNRDNPDQNSATLAALFSLNVGASRAQAVDIATNSARYESVRLDIVTRALEADIHAKYRRIATAESSVHLAERALERAIETLATVDVRDHLGLVTPAEHSAASVSVERARLSLEEARVDLLDAQLAVIAAAHIPEMLPTSILHALPGGFN